MAAEEAILEAYYGYWAATISGSVVGVGVAVLDVGVGEGVPELVGSGAGSVHPASTTSVRHHASAARPNLDAVVIGDPPVPIAPARLPRSRPRRFAYWTPDVRIGEPHD